MTKTIELRHPNGFVLGVASYCEPCSWHTGGWRFFPNVSGHSPSRKRHPTADACLPAWAKRRLKQGCSFLPPSDAVTAARAHAAIVRMKQAAAAANEAVVQCEAIGESKISSDQIMAGLAKAVLKNLGRR